MLGRRLRMPAALAAALTCAALTLTGAQARAAPAGYTGPAGTGSAHANLLVNPGAQAGAYSLRGWDAVTIPGWQVVSGLPSVVRYGSTMLPAVTGHGAAVKNGQLFVGGPGGTARLRQVVSLRSASGSLQPAGSRYTLSALLGADRRDSASAKVTFYSAAGRKLGQASIGPVRGRGTSVPMHYRSGSGRIPAGAATANVVLTLATTLQNIDGPYSPYFGFGRAVADNIRFSVSSPVRQRVLTVPAVKVPRYQHVFLFYFENQDYNAVIGNTRQAPFINSLLPHASLLSDFFAEEHPSDGNYLALAGGSTFGIPLTDPLEENSQYTINAPNIGDLIGTAHENWKAYLQSAAGPCDDTVHGYYWDDDMPMTYFADVRDQPAYCSAHLVPLESLQPDLASAATTPAFSWVSPNDCTDMEGCGIRSGDEFLATELGQIMKSPAWTTQRSLAIITFDEDDTDHQNPAQRVPTIVIGSAGVRQGYVSHVRYTHYSLLRTIEGALGLGTLTTNDRYAQPLNDIFTPGQAASAQPAAATGQASASAPASVTASAPVSVPAGSRAGPPPRQQTAFVVNSASNSVTPVNLVTRKAGNPVKVGRAPDAIAITPDGRTAYVVNSGSGTVTPIATGSGKAGPAIRVGADPQSIAIAPGGATAYVTDAGSDEVTPIDLTTGQALAPIPVGREPHAIAITPDGRTALVLNWGGGSVTPISTQSGRAGAPIRVGGYPSAISVAPDGQTAYVANYGSDTVMPINIPARHAGRPVPAGQAPDALAVSQGSGTVFAVGGDSDTVTPMTASSGQHGPALTAGQAIGVGYAPAAVAAALSGQTVYVVSTISGTVTPVNVATRTADKPISVGLYSYPTAITLAPSGSLAVVVDTYGDQVTLVSTASRKAVKTINVGSYPDAVAIAG